MTGRLFALTLLVWIGGALIGSPAFSRAQDTPKWQTGLSFSYLTGDYGDDETTDIYYGALNVKRYYEIGDVTTTLSALVSMPRVRARCSAIVWRNSGRPAEGP